MASHTTSDQLSPKSYIRKLLTFALQNPDGPQRLGWLRLVTMSDQTRVAAGEPVALHGRKYLRRHRPRVGEGVRGAALAWRTRGSYKARCRSLCRHALAHGTGTAVGTGAGYGTTLGSPHRDARHVLDKLRRATLAMLTLPTLPRHRAMMAFLTTLAWIRPQEFPAGRLRATFCRILERIRDASPVAASPVESYGEAFQRLSDDDVAWIIDQVHTLSLAVAMHVGATERWIPRPHAAGA